MADKELIDSVRAGIRKGYTDSYLKRSLSSKGWGEGDIVAAMDLVRGDAPARIKAGRTGRMPQPMAAPEIEEPAHEEKREARTPRGGINATGAASIVLIIVSIIVIIGSVPMGWGMGGVAGGVILLIIFLIVLSMKGFSRRKSK